MPHLLPAERWSKLEELFSAALDMDPDTRGGFAHAECDGDPELLAELLSLLHYEAVENPEMEAARNACAAHVITVDSAESRMPGQLLGAWRIGPELGRGGMCVVYRAERADGEFDRVVAVKLVKRGMDTDAMVDRLRRERRILAGLEHPWIARLLDGGATPEGRPYLVMEYVDGRPLHGYCEEEVLTVSERCALTEKVCEAISFAHRRLVVHRDLKPANILVTADGTPRILDFGIAHLLAGEGVDSGNPETRSHGQAMTPEYASPEQLSGAPSGTAADVFSLGVILHELLTGVRPYGDETAACGREPLRPSLAAARAGRPRTWCSQLEGDLDTILLQALQLDPARRYQSVEQLHDDLHRWRIGLPVLARRGSVAYRAGKFLRRHRFGSLAAAAVLLLLGGLATTLWQARRASIARERAERRFEQVREMARQITGGVYDQLLELPGSAPAREKLLATALRYYDSLAAESAGNTGLLEEIARGYDRLGDVQGNAYYSNLGDREGAMASYRKAKALREGIADDSAQFLVDRINGDIRLAQMLVSGDRDGLASGIELLEHAGRLAAAAPNHAAPNDAIPNAADYKVQQTLAKVWTTLGDLHDDAGENQLAIRAYTQQLAIASALNKSGREPVAEQRAVAYAERKLGRSYSRIEHVREAREHIEKASAIDTALAARQPNSLEVVRSLYWEYLYMSWLLPTPDGQTRFTETEAREILAKVETLANRMQEMDGGNTAIDAFIDWAQTSWGEWLLARGDAAGALERYRKASASVEHFIAGQPNSREIDEMRLEIELPLGRIMVAINRPGEAAEHLDKAAVLLGGQERRTPGLPFLIKLREALFTARGSVNLMRGEPTKAVQEFSQALSLDESLVARDTGDISGMSLKPPNRMKLATACAAAGQPADAAAAYLAAIADIDSLARMRSLAPGEVRMKAEAQARLRGITAGSSSRPVSRT